MGTIQSSISALRDRPLQAAWLLCWGLLAVALFAAPVVSGNAAAAQPEAYASSGWGIETVMGIQGDERNVFLIPVKCTEPGPVFSRSSALGKEPVSFSSWEYRAGILPPARIPTNSAMALLYAELLPPRPESPARSAIHFSLPPPFFR